MTPSLPLAADVAPQEEARQQPQEAGANGPGDDLLPGRLVGVLERLLQPLPHQLPRQAPGIGFTI